jgi:hypothetical protein
MGSSGYMMVDGILVEKVTTSSQSKSSNVWIWKHCSHWPHLEPTHLLYYTGCTWSPLTLRERAWDADGDARTAEPVVDAEVRDDDGGGDGEEARWRIVGSQSMTLIKPV